MTNKEILKKAIGVANKNGYEFFYEDIIPKISIKQPDPVTNELIAGLVLETYAPIIIFSHDFAKAFWGEEKECVGSDKSGVVYKKAWRKHLSKMVLEEEPLKYLERFL